MKTDVAVIRDLVSCKSEEVKSVAKRHKVKSAIASVIREHWTRSLSGLCVRCGDPVKKGKCPKCGSTAHDTIGLLKKIKPRTPLLRRQCGKCKKNFTHNAGYVLKMTLKHGSFRPSNLCRTCKVGERPEEKKPETNTQKKAVKKNIDPTLYAGDHPGDLKHSPFKMLRL